MALDIRCGYLYLYGHGRSLNDLGGVRSPPRRCSSSHRLGTRATFGRRRSPSLSGAPTHGGAASHHPPCGLAESGYQNRVCHQRPLCAPLLDGGHRSGSGRRSHASRRCRTARPLPPPSRSARDSGARGPGPLGTRSAVGTGDDPGPVPGPAPSSVTRIATRAPSVHQPSRRRRMRSRPRGSATLGAWITAG